MLVIDPWQKLSFLIVAIKVPPRSEVVGRGERALELAQSSQVPKHVIEERTVPLLTMVVDWDSSMRCSECIQHIDLEVRARFDNRSGNQTTLRDSKYIYLFVSVIRVVVKLVTYHISLVLYWCENGCICPITDFKTPNDSWVVERLWDHVHPRLHYRARTIDAMQQSYWSNNLLIIISLYHLFSFHKAHWYYRCQRHYFCKMHLQFFFKL